MSLSYRCHLVAAFHKKTATMRQNSLQRSYEGRWLVLAVCFRAFVNSAAIRILWCLRSQLHWNLLRLRSVLMWLLLRLYKIAIGQNNGWFSVIAIIPNSFGLLANKHRHSYCNPAESFSPTCCFTGRWCWSTEVIRKETWCIIIFFTSVLVTWLISQVPRWSENQGSAYPSIFLPAILPCWEPKHWWSVQVEPSSSHNIRKNKGMIHITDCRKLKKDFR